MAKLRLADALRAIRPDTALKEAGTIAGRISRLSEETIARANDRAYERTNEETIARANDRAYERTSKQTSKQTSKPSNEQSNEQMSGQAPGKSSFLLLQLTDTQERVLDYLIRQGNVVMAIAEMAKKTGVPYGSLRRSLSGLEVLGYFKSRYFQKGKINGTEFTLNTAQCSAFLTAKTSQQTSEQTNGQTSEQANEQTDEQTNASKIDRFRKTISIYEENKKLSGIDNETFKFQYQNLDKIGFGVDQLRQIISKLEGAGKTVDRLQIALEHANYEWGRPQQLPLSDAAGNPILKPLDYVFATLARTGYYRRPEGYISPEEQAELDQEAELRALANVRERLEQAKFDAWLANLPDEELEKILEKRPGYRPGKPKGVTASTAELAWLKSHWIKTRQT